MKLLTKTLLAAALLTGGAYTTVQARTIKKIITAGDVQDRHLSGFNAVDAAGSFDIYIQQGSVESVKVEAPADVIENIATEVEGGVLKIHSKHNSNWGSWFNGSHKKIAVYVTAKDLNSIGITGSGDIFFKEGIHTNTLKLRVVGSGDVLGKLDVKTLEASIAGSGDIKISGHAENSEISVSGSGDFTARDLVTTNTKVRVSGSGDADINASNSIEASVSGSGDVRYTGSAKNISKKKSGSGDIERL